MIQLSIFFFAGVVLLHLQADLPAVSSFLVALLPALMLLVLRLRWPLILMCGFGWAAQAVMQVPTFNALPVVEGQTVLVQGRITGIPQLGDRRVRFVLDIDQFLSGTEWMSRSARVRLNWYGTNTPPVTGETWQLAVRLRRPRGYANPGGFDYERWLFQQRISATGYVRNDDRNRRTGIAAPAGLTAFRARVAETTSAQADRLAVMSMLPAVTVGVRDAMTDSQWQVLRATGTSHLVAISGLHISLVAGLLFALTRQLWRCSARLVEYVPAGRAAACVALLGATQYAVLAGFGIPAQRALIMIAVVTAAIALCRRVDFVRTIAIAVLASLLLDPLSMLSAGWWLSFWAVCVIAWFTTGRQADRQVARRWLLMPVAVALGMTPLLAGIFQQYSLLAPVANIVAVPWVSFLVVPAALAGTALFAVNETVGLLMLQAAGWLLHVVWQGLVWLAELPFALPDARQSGLPVLLAGMAGLLLLCLPHGVPARWPGLVLLLPMTQGSDTAPAAGDAWLTVLDVGQGLAAVVQTATHTLVFDSGPRLGATFDTGAVVLVPFLRQAGIREIDTLMVSHGDNDHAGGARSLLDAIPVKQVLSSVPDRFPAAHAVACRRGQAWLWDQVRFSIEHPGTTDALAGNDGSCVLRISTASGMTILLTGDIEARAEALLVDRDAARLAVDVLVVPHHGSDTSSTSGFVAAAAPRIAIVPAAHDNRYGFPADTVVQRYRAAGARVVQTGSSGAVSVRPVGAAGAIELTRHREHSRRYWRWLP